MKKLVAIFISLILFILLMICIVIWFDRNNTKDIEKVIVKNTEIKNIEYVNIYDGYYIVMDLDNLYLFDKEYEEIFNIKVDKLHKNKNNYDIIYRNKKVMYMDSYKNKKKGLVFKYYDIYTYELIDKIVIGGN